MRDHLTAVRMAITSKFTGNKGWRGCGERGALLHCWWGWKLAQPLWRSVRRFLRTPSLEPTVRPSQPAPGHTCGRNFHQKDTRAPMSTAALVTTAETWKQPTRPSAGERMKKMWYIHTMEYYSAIKRMKMTFAAIRIQLEIPILSQKEKDKPHMISLMCGI